MSATVRWDRLAGLRTPVLMLLAFAAISAGVFMIYVPAGWIAVGLALMFVAVVTDTEGSTGDRSR